MKFESLRKIKFSDPQKYERIIYVRKIALPLFLLALLLVSWLDLPICQYTFYYTSHSSCNPFKYIYLFLFLLLVAFFLIMKITNWFLRRKYGVPEVLRQEEEKRAVELRVASKKENRSVEIFVYMSKMNGVLLGLFTVVIGMFLEFIHDVFGVIPADKIIPLAISLGGIAAILVTHKKTKDKFGGYK